MSAYLANSGMFPAADSFWDGQSRRQAPQSRREPVPSRGAVAAAWLPDLYTSVVRAQDDDALDMIYQHFDDLLSEEKFDVCNDLLAAIDLGRLNVVAMMAVVSITRPAADRLERRSRVVERVRARIQALEPERAERLLAVVR